MKKKLYLITTICLFLINNAFSQKLIDVKKEKESRLVEHLNTPTKIWTNGFWEIQIDGTKVWKKGHWTFREKSFQQKSEILRQTRTHQPKA